MPPKNTHETGALFFSTDGGETLRPLAKVTEIPSLPEPYIEGEDGYEMVVPPRELEMTFTATTIISRNLILFLFGDKRLIPNNWLKFHGHPMRRKAYKRRRREDTDDLVLLRVMQEP